MLTTESGKFLMSKLQSCLLCIGEPRHPDFSAGSLDYSRPPSQNWYLVCQWGNLSSRKKRVLGDMCKWRGDSSVKGHKVSKWPGVARRDALSAAIFKIPGRWRAVKWKLKVAESQNKFRIHFIIASFRHVPLFKAATVTELSEKIMIRLFLQKGAQRNADKVTASTSFSFMWKLSACGQSWDQFK